MSPSTAQQWTTQTSDLQNQWIMLNNAAQTATMQVAQWWSTSTGNVTLPILIGGTGGGGGTWSQAERRPPEGFNRYINASDLMEEFIGYLAGEGVRQREVLGLPLDLFIKWLIIRACEEDREEPNVTLALPARPAQPRCLGCQRFMALQTRLPLHGPACAGRYFERVAA